MFLQSCAEDAEECIFFILFLPQQGGCQEHFAAEKKKEQNVAGEQLAG